MIPDQLLLLQNGQQVGPFPRDAIQAMLESGSVTRDDYVWGEGMAEWATLGVLMPDVVPGSASSVAPATEPAASSSTPKQGFGSFISDAFSYPFRGDGVIILILGTLVFTVLNFAGRFSWYVSIAAWGYLMLMLQSVIHGTAMGEQTVPKWPDFDGMGELAGKWFQWMVALALCMGPALFFLIRWNITEDDSLLIWVILFGFSGAVYFPMGILGVAMYDSLVALNPMLVVRSILRVPGHYVLTLLVFAGLIAVKAFTVRLSDVLPGVVGGIIGHVVDEFDELWSAIFLARVLGGLYYVNRKKLGWFER
jgi:hypothetical protein